MNITDFVAVNTAVEQKEIDSEKAIRVVKAGKIYEYDENTYAKLKDIEHSRAVQGLRHCRGHRFNP